MEAMFTPQSFRQLRLRDTTALSASREAPATIVSALISDSDRCKCNISSGGPPDKPMKQSRRGRYGQCGCVVVALRAACGGYLMLFNEQTRSVPWGVAAARTKERLSSHSAVGADVGRSPGFD